MKGGFWIPCRGRSWFHDQFHRFENPSWLCLSLVNKDFSFHFQKDGFSAAWIVIFLEKGQSTKSSFLAVASSSPLAKNGGPSLPFFTVGQRSLQLLANVAKVHMIKCLVSAGMIKRGLALRLGVGPSCIIFILYTIAVSPSSITIEVGQTIAR